MQLIARKDISEMTYYVSSETSNSTCSFTLLLAGWHERHAAVKNNNQTRAIFKARVYGIKPPRNGDLKILSSLMNLKTLPPETFPGLKMCLWPPQTQLREPTALPRPLAGLGEGCAREKRGRGKEGKGREGRSAKLKSLDMALNQTTTYGGFILGSRTQQSGMLPQDQRNSNHGTDVK